MNDDSTTFETDEYVRDFVADNYLPAYADQIVSIGGSPQGKFYMVYIEVAPKQYEKILVPTTPRQKGN
jgi:hypothetical protein